MGVIITNFTPLHPIHFGKIKMEIVYGIPQNDPGTGGNILGPCYHRFILCFLKAVCLSKYIKNLLLKEYHN